MKTFRIIIKIITALAAVAGTIYIIAAYGDRIVDWAKSVISGCPCGNLGADKTPAPADAAESKEESAVPSEDAASEETENASVPSEVPVDETVPVADDADFEG